MMPYLVAAAIRTYLITLPEHQRRGGAVGQLATSGIRAANKGSRRFHNRALFNLRHPEDTMLNGHLNKVRRDEFGKPAQRS